MRRPLATPTMLVAVLLFVGGAGFGFKLLTAQADTTGDAATCENHTVAAGGNVTPNLVVLNVYNASQKSGRANRVSIALQRKGFLAGDIGNAPQQVSGDNVTILTDDKTDPLVQLVSKQFEGTVTYATPTATLPDGVSVILGDKYKRTDPKAVRSIKASRSVTVCLPIADPSS